MAPDGTDIGPAELDASPPLLVADTALQLAIDRACQLRRAVVPIVVHEVEELLVALFRPARCEQMQRERAAHERGLLEISERREAVCEAALDLPVRAGIGAHESGGVAVELDRFTIAGAAGFE